MKQEYCQLTSRNQVRAHQLAMEEITQKQQYQRMEVRVRSCLVQAPSNLRIGVTFLMHSHLFILFTLLSRSARTGNHHFENKERDSI